MMAQEQLHVGMVVYYIQTPPGKPKNVTACVVEDLRPVCNDPASSKPLYPCVNVEDERKMAIRLCEMYGTREEAESCL